MARRYQDLGSASDWIEQSFNQSGTTQILELARHRCGASALVSRMSFRGETKGGVPKCWPFSQAICDLALSFSAKM